MRMRRRSDSGGEVADPGRTGPSLRIFLNYRREDASGHAGRLYDALSERFGAGNVFMDVDAIEPGLDFSEVVSDRVEDCDVLIAMIGKKWLDVSDSRGRNRLDRVDDFVRVELRAGLEREGTRVIPVLVQGAEMPSVEDLPEDLHKLAYRNAVELRDTSWTSDVARLERALSRLAEQRLGQLRAQEDERLAARGTARDPDEHAHAEATEPERPAAPTTALRPEPREPSPGPSHHRPSRARPSRRTLLVVVGVAALAAAGIGAALVLLQPTSVKPIDLNAGRARFALSGPTTTTLDLRLNPFGTVYWKPPRHGSVETSTLVFHDQASNSVTMNLALSADSGTDSANPGSYAHVPSVDVDFNGSHYSTSGYGNCDISWSRADETVVKGRLNCSDLSHRLNLTGSFAAGTSESSLPNVAAPTSATTTATTTTTSGKTVQYYMLLGRLPSSRLTCNPSAITSFASEALAEANCTFRGTKMDVNYWLWPNTAALDSWYSRFRSSQHVAPDAGTCRAVPYSGEGAIPGASAGSRYFCYSNQFVLEVDHNIVWTDRAHFVSGVAIVSGKGALQAPSATQMRTEFTLWSRYLKPH